ncbi:hypothetical protein ABTZ58_09490 [Streptomyces sp. NPDC094143]|uniref:hypothetical protein n=1 Tax=Streptomyces sp. NPDC094143 TaxID=3155310 RepID=UPI00332C279D
MGVGQGIGDGGVGGECLLTAARVEGEAEPAVIIGRRLRRAGVKGADEAIAGYAVVQGPLVGSKRVCTEASGTN